MSDDEMIANFEACTLSHDMFHHADHVHMAFLYLRRYPGLEALRRFSASLKNFAAAKGSPGRYHETITWALLLLIRERMARSNCEQSWSEFSVANPDLLGWNNNPLKKYYWDATLSSDLARSIFLFPDKFA